MADTTAATPAGTAAPAATTNSNAPPSAARALLRTVAASLCQACAAASFALAVVAIVSLSWDAKPTTKGISGVGSTVEVDRWIDLSPSAGNCTCITTHASYCAEIADAFQASAYLSVAVLVSQGLMVLVLCYELGLYGPYGGSHTFTRVHLILALVTLGTELLSIFAWWSTFFVQHCGDPSFQENAKAAIGWPFYLRCVEAFGMAAYVLYIVGQFSKSNRGPPAMPMLAALFFCALTAVTTFAKGWMSITDDYDYGLFSACKCTSGFGGGFCNGSVFWTLTLGAGIVACVAAFATMFFASLRCVDSDGLTLKFATIGSAVSLVALIISVAGFFVAHGTSAPCDSSQPLVLAGYTAGFPSALLIASLVSQAVFLIINVVYSTKDTYKEEWWNHLKDARTKAHEARENEEGNDDESEAESDEDAEMEAEEKKTLHLGDATDKPASE